MFTLFDPMEGLEPEQKAKAIYNNEGDYDDDVNKMIQYLGGVDNIKTIGSLKEALTDVDPTATYYEVELCDFEKTVFYKQNCSTRLLNARLGCFHIDKKTFVGAKNPFNSYIKALQKHYFKKSKKNK